MSRFSGRQYKGALRVLREIKREEAEARQKKSDKRKAILDEVTTALVEVYSSEEIAEQLGIKNENPGPALPGLAKRARKVTRKS